MRETIEGGALRGDAVRLARFLGGTIRSLVLGAGKDGRTRIEDDREAGSTPALRKKRSSSSPR